MVFRSFAYLLPQPPERERVTLCALTQKCYFLYLELFRTMSSLLRRKRAEEKNTPQTIFALLNFFLVHLIARKGRLSLLKASWVLQQIYYSLFVYYLYICGVRVYCILFGAWLMVYVVLVCQFVVFWCWFMVSMILFCMYWRSSRLV